ncbi:hypothetical protein [Chitinophaga sp. MM2321]|uniref:hypothetical protein n=1 Tax=Chitinophaga sp. MM2321 TaxID=3137178 RepID=UPI0032D58A4C
MAEVRISSPHLVSQLLSKEERMKNILVLGLDGKINAAGEWTADLDLIIRSIKVSVLGFSRTKKYYVGAPGATLRLDVTDGAVQQYSKGKPLEVNHTETKKSIGKISLKIKPEIEAHHVKASVAEVEKSRDKESASTSSYPFTEMWIEAIKYEDQVEWRIDLPEGNHVVRDYLLGNIPFSATIKWNIKEKQGTFFVAPSDIFFYNKKNKKIDKMKTLLMRFALHHFQKESVKNPEGLRFNFEIYE